MDAPNMPPPNFYAFPFSIAVSDGRGGMHYNYCGGMLARDFLAAAALTGIVASGSGMEDKARAEWAYELADAMLKAREGK